jgi:hypothetical protein
VKGAPNKYGAKRTECAHGHTHASKREAKRCGELHLLLRAGQIEALVYEPQYWFEINGETIKHPNGRRVGYKPDFSYIERGRVVAEDVKSSATMTGDSVLRMSLFRHLFPGIELRVLK